MTGEGLPEQTVSKNGNYLYGELNVFWKIKMIGEVLPEQTVGIDGIYVYCKLNCAMAKN
jgi:hypothetical protein